MIQEAQNPQPQAAAGRKQSELHKILSEAQGPVELAPISNAPITLKLTEKSSVIYETVGKLAGINVLFDPDYTPKQVRIELNGVTLEEALSIISFETKAFWRPITPDTIFIAQDNPAKRKSWNRTSLKLFIFPISRFDRIAGCGERDAHNPGGKPHSAVALAAGDRGARNA